MKNMKFIILLILSLYSYSLISQVGMTFGTDSNMLGFVYDYPGFLHLDFKTNVAPTIYNNYYSNITLNQSYEWGDDELGHCKDYTSINIGFSYYLSKKNNISMYSGGGITYYNTAYKFYDDLEILGNRGTYWISDDNYEIRTNIIIGVIYRYKELFFMAGYNRVPSELELGIGYNF